MTDWEADCVKWMGRVLTGKRAHWCPEWDGLPIDETCGEIEACRCPYEFLTPAEKRRLTPFQRSLYLGYMRGSRVRAHVCHWCVWGTECPLYFADPPLSMTDTLKHIYPDHAVQKWAYTDASLLSAIPKAESFL